MRHLNRKERAALELFMDSLGASFTDIEDENDENDVWAMAA